MSSRPARREDFEIAIICALPLEFDAASFLLEEAWEEYANKFGDTNYYTHGRIGKRSVVLVLLPGIGKAHAAAEAAALRTSYSGLQLALITGICGAVPHPTHSSEILLGDVVISDFIIQYDLRRQYLDMFRRKNSVPDSLGRFSKDIRSTLQGCRADRGREQLEERTAAFLQ
ncbi:hypothetical protein TOPH_02898 [Tolypocladium ophioglossoides CBS 100239]|uniref:Nucleoside phosphorylase domain-containing protein n=1 Tax=Tolypocladium ophioglossoides (strain CBS 100239) TaxID=1163406 RepID=A0A0L0NGI3_TOLOC|nr:hypothetical protein TOPH_02898 [Tolypocladium ophioglossoides CBS 100239]